MILKESIWGLKIFYFSFSKNCYSCNLLWS